MWLRNSLITINYQHFFTVGITDDDIDSLQSIEYVDPEVRPGLFQGDMALNNEVHD